MNLHALPRIKPLSTRIKKAVEDISPYSQFQLITFAIMNSFSINKYGSALRAVLMEEDEPRARNVRNFSRKSLNSSPIPWTYKSLSPPQVSFDNLTTQVTVANNHPNNFVHKKKKSERPKNPVLMFYWDESERWNKLR